MCWCQQMHSWASYYMLASCTVYMETFIYRGFDLLCRFGALSKRIWQGRGMESQQREWEVGDGLMEWVVDGLEWLNYSYLILVCRGKLSRVLRHEGRYQNAKIPSLIQIYTDIIVSNLYNCFKCRDSLCCPAKKKYVRTKINEGAQAWTRQLMVYGAVHLVTTTFG